MPDALAPSSAPSAPPTPPVSLAALLAREELGLRRIAGPEDADLHWVHTSEMGDPYPYLLGGELLLTAGVQLTDPDHYVSQVVAAGAAALGFGVAPVYDTVPPALVAACDRHGLPLVEVPPPTTFTAIARAVWRLMAEARHRELRRVAQAQQGLATAAARPDPVPAVLRQLTARLDGAWAVLLSAEGAPLATAGRPPSPDAHEALARLARVVNPPQPEPTTSEPAAPRTAPTGTPTPPAVPPASRTAPATGPGPKTTPAPASGPSPKTTPAPTPPPGPAPRTTPASATDTAGGSHLAAYALAGGQRLVLGVASDRREAGDHTIAGVAVVLLSLLTTPHQGAAESARAAALVRLLLGADAAEVAPLLGAGGWTVVHARPVAAPAGPDPLAAAALGAALGSALVDATEEGVVRVLLAGDARDIEPQPGWTLGASSPVPASDLPAAGIRAERAVRRAEATRSPVVRDRAEAGEGLASLITPDEARAHARVQLAPIADSPALTSTLRTWLSLHGSWDRTAVALDVHRNTVRQRIARCATLLDADLDDADVRMDLWFALRWL
ncbi:PucR family transcriptional regulator ligand-binding domain-containing protein [Streptomyces flavidovirens]|uniref:PucR family transcriptional regulator ligand-binding domain-containing protein n=1 Tax=Streptomyces flavidovirens TaxID=67298 RepID=UPI0033A97581